MYSWGGCIHYKKGNSVFGGSSPLGSGDTEQIVGHMCHLNKKLGAIDYLIKPIAPDDLERLVKETLLKCECGE